jgi:two-component system sensor histidine kinase DesK
VRIDSSRQGFVLEVVDDGRGVRRAEGSGLTGMRERLAALGGTVEVETSTAGTVVRVLLPQARRGSEAPGDEPEPEHRHERTAAGHP